MSASSGYHRLHKGVQRWLWTQNWTELRDIQERAIEPILEARCDVVVSAATAAGKTEAAFLPACSRVAELALKGIGILYVSPLKALINDQQRRLQSLCDLLDLPLTPWHGDVLRSVKDKQKRNPRGIVLITPESLESLLLRQSGWCKQAFAETSHIVLDEFHAFLGTERGCQLLSLMHRMEFLLGRTVPRIALSATLGDMQQVAGFLRPPGSNFPCQIIASDSSRSELKIQVRGYLDPASGKTPPCRHQIADDLYKILRGRSHLIFANSRTLTESLSASLSDRCDKEGVPNEFFPHHGSLSKDIRERLEARLQERKLPTSAVCTMTLEMGIDIGNVDSIAQVGIPPSVASLRQRVGRSGRRGDASVLRMFVCEKELTANSSLIDRLRLETIQGVAMIDLLLKKWCEPALEQQHHLSTLVQQTLSTIGQHGGVRAGQLWSLLCGTGPFSRVDQKLYADFLRALGEQDLITQTHDGQLVLGSKGELLVDSCDFCTAFKVSEEHRLECAGRVLGSIPIEKPLEMGQSIIFAGRCWEVLEIIPDQKLILLKPALGGAPPTFSGCSPWMVHDEIRRKMLLLYKEKTIPIYLDASARARAEEGMQCFHALELHDAKVLQMGKTIYLFPWLGDRIVCAITQLLCRNELKANNYGGIIAIDIDSVDSLRRTVHAVLGSDKPSSADLASYAATPFFEKHDALLPKAMRELAYGAKFFDVDAAWSWLAGLLDFLDKQAGDVH